MSKAIDARAIPGMCPGEFSIQVGFENSWRPGIVAQWVQIRYATEAKKDATLSCVCKKYKIKDVA